MIKILFYINNLGGGGAEKVLCDLVAGMDKESYDITVMSKDESGIYVSTIKEHVKYKALFKTIKPGKNFLKKIINVVYTNIREYIFKNHPRILYYLFINQKFDVEVAFLEGYSTKVISGSNNKHSKKITWVHSDLEQNHWTKDVYKSFKEEIKCYKKFDSIVCVSESVAESFKRFYGIGKHVNVKYNPVNELDILEKANGTLHIDKEKGKITLVTVGRLVHQKGYDRLVKVCKMLKDEGFNYNLWIVGEGEQRELLEEFIRENDLRDTIKLLGFQSNPYKYMKQADLFVCSSRVEGLSTVVTEALILGKPIITTDCPGMNELLEFGKYGILVDNNTESLYKGIKKILLNSELIARYSERAKNRGQFFSLDNTIAAIEDIL